MTGPTTYLSDDFSVYVTIMNRTNDSFQLVSFNGGSGDFHPRIIAPWIDKKDQISFTLTPKYLSGSEGNVTYYATDQNQKIRFSFQCPFLDNNKLSIPENQTSYHVTYYGSTTYVSWNPHGHNWGPPNNYPYRGHPLIALFVIDDFQ